MRTLVDVALRREPAIIRTLFFLAPFITLLAPKTTVLWLVLLFACCVGLSLVRGQQLKPLFRLDLGLVLFGAIAAYVFINATWSLDPSRAFGKALWFTLVVVMSYGACRALATWERRQVRMAVTAFLVGLTAGAAIVLFEVASGRLLTLALYNVLPFTQPESVKSLVVQGGEIIRIAGFELNRNVAIMLLMLWPALLCLTLRGSTRRHAFAVAGLFLVTSASVLLSRHESSKVGLVSSVIVFALALAWPIFVRRCVLAIWCLAFLLAVPLAMLAYKAELHKVSWLRYSAKDRVALWAYTAEQIPKAPILGIGATSTRKMDLDPETRLKAIKAKQERKGFQLRGGAHAHNAFLQIWYELGAIGVMLFMAAGSVVILRIGQLPASTQAYVLAQFAALFPILAFGWGMWQSWLMAVAGLLALYATLAVSVFRASESLHAAGEQPLDRAP